MASRTSSKSTKQQSKISPKLEILSTEIKRILGKMRSVDTKTSLIVGAFIVVVGLGVIVGVKNSQANAVPPFDPMMMQGMQQPMIMQGMQQPAWNQGGAAQWGSGMNSMQNPMFMNTVAQVKKVPTKAAPVAAPAPIVEPIIPAGQMLVRQKDIQELQNDIMRMQNDVNQLEQGIIQSVAILEASANQIDANRRRAEIALDNAKRTVNQGMELAQQRARDAAERLRDLRQRAEDVRDNLNTVMAQATRIGANIPVGGGNVKNVMFMQPVNADRRNMMMGQGMLTGNMMMAPQMMNPNFQMQPNFNTMNSPNMPMPMGGNSMGQMQPAQSWNSQWGNADPRNQMGW